MRDLPPPVARFAVLAAAPGPRAVETVVIETTAWMRHSWMPQIPLEIRMTEPGKVPLGQESPYLLRILCRSILS